MLQARYLKGNSFFSYTLKKRCSLIWQGIIHAGKTLRLGSCYKIGDGYNINVWKDPWVPSLTDFCVVTKANVDQSQWKNVADLRDEVRIRWNSQAIQDIFE